MGQQMIIVFTMQAVFTLILLLLPQNGLPATWSLSDDERRAHLRYYSPIILKRSNENSYHERGLDLITNFDFDRDSDFSNNKRNWEDIYQYVEQNSALSSWQIRPTLYSSIIEFMEGASKSIILIYHIYHAKQETSIHDWERVEVRVDNVRRQAGVGSERVKFVVVTKHSDHKVRVFGDGDLNFMTTQTGKHPIVWQAQWSGNYPEIRRAELRFVEDSWHDISSRISRNRDAEVEVTGTRRKKNVNYVFVCDCSSGARTYWGSRGISRTTARNLTAGVREQVDWDDVPRVNYELQDLADILSSHTAYGRYWRHWSSPSYSIRLTSPLRNESGVIELSSGWHTFFYRAIDDEDRDEDRDGYPNKSWFWGAYDLGGSDNLKSKAFRGTFGVFQGGPRGVASGFFDSHSSYWWQHDYFAHSGRKGSGDYQYGRWLPADWHTSQRGGFDGRWVQLFDD